MREIENPTCPKHKSFREIVIFAAIMLFAAATMIIPLAVAFVAIYLTKNLNIELGHRLNVSSDTVALMMMAEFGLLAFLLVKLELIILKLTHSIEIFKKWTVKWLAHK
jgi:hypothetical protein